MNRRKQASTPRILSQFSDRVEAINRQQESLTVYTDGFRAYEPLEEDDEFNGEYVVHGDGEYADDEVHVNTCESHASRCDGGSRPTEVSPKIS